MAVPSAREQLEFLFKIQRLLSEGAFVSTYKFALLLALAECAVERGSDRGEPLSLNTTVLAEEPEVDHFIPWSRYPIDLGHNFVLAHSACNLAKADRLPAVEHLANWARRNHHASLTSEFRSHGLPYDLPATFRIASWAYKQAERAGSQLWFSGREGLEPHAITRSCSARACCNDPTRLLITYCR